MFPKSGAAHARSAANPLPFRALRSAKNFNQSGAAAFWEHAEAGSDVEDVESDMSSLIDEANSDAAVQNVLKAGAYFHVNFENIHPFADGNGRVGRTLLNYWFLINRHPPVIIFDEDRESYYNAFEEFDRNLTLVPMVDFLRHEVEKTWGKKPVLEKSIKLSNYL